MFLLMYWNNRELKTYSKNQKYKNNKLKKNKIKNINVHPVREGLYSNVTCLIE